MLNHGLRATRKTIYQIRDVFETAGFDEAGVLKQLDTDVLPSLSEIRHSLPRLLRRTDGRSPLDSLIRLFVLRQAVSAVDARRAAAPMQIEDWFRAGLLENGRDGVRAKVGLWPVGNVIAAADWPGESTGEIDQVMAPGASSRALMQMTIRRRAENTLDLGTGCGIQAITASAHSGRVTATDINPRALAFARFNADLNRRPSIDLRGGSLFDPVAGMKFDLITCNPPFVIAPQVLYRHTMSGEPKDAFCERLVRAAPAYLTENGFAQIVCNWVRIGGQAPSARVQEWTAGSSCDVWVLHSHSEAAAEYALRRSHEMTSDPDAADSLYHQWLDYFEREEIEAVEFGVITLQLASKGSNWFRYDEMPGVSGLCGRSIEAGFLLRDYLESHQDDNSLLESRVFRASNLQIVRSETGEGRLCRIRLADGLTFSADLDSEVAEFVSECSGNITLGEYLQTIAAARQQTVSYLMPGFLAVTRRLIQFGFLIPAEIFTRLDGS